MLSVIMVRDPQTHTNPPTGPISIQCTIFSNPAPAGYDCRIWGRIYQILKIWSSLFSCFFFLIVNSFKYKVAYVAEDGQPIFEDGHEDGLPIFVDGQPIFVDGLPIYEDRLSIFEDVWKMDSPSSKMASPSTKMGSPSSKMCRRWAAHLHRWAAHVAEDGQSIYEENLTDQFTQRNSNKNLSRI